MFRRHTLSVSLLCLQLSGLPIPLPHVHAGLVGSRLANHMAKRHSHARPERDWHWHWVPLGESDDSPTIGRSEVDLAEVEVFSASVCAEDGRAPTLIPVRQFAPVRVPPSVFVGRVGVAASCDGPSQWRALLGTWTL